MSEIWVAAPTIDSWAGCGVRGAGVLPAGSCLWAGHLPMPGFLVCPQIEDETQVSRATQGEQDNYEMHVRAANIVSHQVEGPARAPVPWGSH